MKNLDLNAYGVSEMSVSEVKETNGGSILGTLIMAAAMVIIGLLIEKAAIDGNPDTIATVGGKRQGL